MSVEPSKILDLFSMPVLTGILGATLYIAWEFSEWRQVKEGPRIPLDAFIVKGLIYVIVAGVLCHEYSTKDGHLSFLAALQIGVSSPLIWRQMYEGGTKGKLENMRSREESVS